jgi:hypothetical protein
MSTDNQELNTALYFTCKMCGNNYHRSPQSSEAGTCEKCAMIIWGLPPKPEQDQNTETTYLKRPLPKLATKEYMTEFAIEWCRAKFNDHTDRHAKLGLLIDFISDYHN